ncbi:NAD(P)-binding domain-containing protein [Microbacterium sp. G2-8]|uniref:NAD(P)-binding domain-containing protein n=1 Tax=Microbacterium sp. G2-8 TaxID=2842454 RepID=UPI001C8B06B6|nr:NAD(P)-binding domain-containing protein [Microbacterium sp. G2-8]
MRIGILGAGAIGSILSERLPMGGHDVMIANSRGPGAISPAALRSAARAVKAVDAVGDFAARPRSRSSWCSSSRRPVSARFATSS